MKEQYNYKGKKYTWKELFDKTDYFEVIILPQLKERDKKELEAK